MVVVNGGIVSGTFKLAGHIKYVSQPWHFPADRTHTGHSMAKVSLNEYYITGCHEQRVRLSGLLIWSRFDTG